MLSRYVQYCKIGHPGTIVKNRAVNLTTHQEWARFHETHPYILRSAHNIVAQLDKEDTAQLALVLVQKQVRCFIRCSQAQTPNSLFAED